MTTRVLLVHPPVNFRLGKMPAMSSLYVGYGLLHMAECLRRGGYEVSVWNLEEALRMGISEEVIRRMLSSLKPIVVGVELNWVHFGRGSLQMAKLVKDVLNEVPVVLGGTHATLFAKEIVQKHHGIVDGVLRGEAEKTFSQVVRNVEEKGSLGDVGGLVAFDEGRVREVPLRKGDIYEDIDDVPPYSWKAVRHVVWGIPMMRAPIMVSVNSCRGPCPYQCVYCIGGSLGPLMGRDSYAVHSPNWIVSQINLLLQEGAGEFAFQDDLYLCGKKRLVELARTLKREGLTDKVVGFNMTSVPGLLDRGTLRALARAGVFNIDYGVESGSEKVLRMAKRPTSRARILDSVKATTLEGIIPFTWWLTGLPGEGFEDIEQTFRLIDDTIGLGAVPKWVTPVIALPGTEMFEKPEEYGVKLRMRSFEDFLIFSDLKSKSISSYLRAITHETERLSAYSILQMALSMKRHIFGKREEIVENFRRYLDMVTLRHPQLSAEMLEERVKNHLNYIPRTFF